MPGFVESFLLSDQKREALTQRRVSCVRQSKVFQQRVETKIKTKLQIEGGKITVEQEMAQDAQQYLEEVTTSICAELDEISAQVAEGQLAITEGIAQYRERTHVGEWPTVMLEAEPGESVEQLAKRAEEMGYVLAKNTYAEEEAPALKFAPLGMLQAHVPPDVAFVKPLADIEGVAGVYDAERKILAPQPKPAELAAEAKPAKAKEPKFPGDFPESRGEGAAICIIDSGIDKNHADLAGRVVAERDFSGEGDTGDYMGHGTHCAGIAAGAGAASNGQFAGVAPHAKLLNARVFDKDGAATTEAILSAMRWAMEHKADVINMSLGQEGGITDGASLLARACDKAAEAGIVVCVSAGNEGPEAGSLSSPGDAAQAITVAAEDTLGGIADFSGRGPTAAPDTTGPKPTVCAPGVNIVAPLSSQSPWPPIAEGEPYTAASGTSMAAPFVAGCAAALVGYLRARKTKGNLEPVVKAALVETAAKLKGFDEDAQGAGLVSLSKAADYIAQGRGALLAAVSSDGPAVITLGQSEAGPVSLKADTFQRHFACLGSSGSGKTVACKVICEEFIRQGVPVIAIDPQGDIARMGERATEASVTKKGVPAEILRQYDEKADVVIWTPASSKGIPLCVNPLNFDFDSADTEVVVHSLSAMADSICTLMGYDLDKDDGNSAQSFLYMVFEHIYNTGRAVDSFTALVDAIGDLPEPIVKRASNIISEREIRTLTRKMLNLTIGAKGLMFEHGVPLDVDTLLGRGDDSGKVRLSVIYLNSLSSQEEKDFFVCQIAEKIYHWMLRNPGDQKGLQAVFYIDEIAKFIPPVRKPACKDALMMLFRQARKYGVGCVIATQSPGDIDYTALDQFATWNLGQMKTKQTRAKVIDFLQALDPEKAEAIGGQLAGLQKGNFIILSADEFDEPIPYKVRWLVTKHGSPLSDDDVAKRTTAEMRKRFSVPEQTAKMERGAQAEAPPLLDDDEVEQHAAAVERALSDAGHALASDELMETLDLGLTDEQTQYLLRRMEEAGTIRLHEFYGLPGQEAPAFPPKSPAEAPLFKAASAGPQEAVAEEPAPPEPEPEPEPEPTDEERVVELLLNEKRCLSTAEIGDAIDANSSRVLRLMSGLVAKNLVAKDKLGSSNVYWHADYDLRPQEGQAEAVTVAALKVSERDARTAAEETLAGFFSKSEKIADTEFRHMPLWQVDVKVEETSGIIFKTKTEATATIYLDATDGRICYYDASKGFAFSDVVDESPTKIRDLDDVCTFEEKMPGEVELDPRALEGLLDEDEVRKLVERKYIAKVQSAKLVLLPHWRFRIESTDGAKSRELMLDGVTGKPLAR